MKNIVEKADNEYKTAIVGELSKLLEAKGFISSESKIKKVLFNEVSFIIAGIGLVSSVMFWVMNPQQLMEIKVAKLESQIESNQTVAAELQRIKTNDLHELQLRLDQIETRQIDTLKAIARLEALISR